MKTNKALFGILLTVVACPLFAAETEAWFIEPNVPVLESPAANNFKFKHNAATVDQSFPIDAAHRPFSEYEEARYFILSSGFNLNSQTAKTGMVENLPDGVTAIVTTHTQSNVSQLQSYYEKFIDKDRLEVLYIPGGGGFWARDSMPVPVVEGTKLALVDAKYDHKVEPDAFMANYLGVGLLKHAYYFEGGNFVTDRNGNCIIVNTNYVATIPSSVFFNQYGCRKLLRLPYKKGIGHADERVKILSDTVAVTDEPSYVSSLEQLGYSVSLLPQAKNYYETYVNSLLINGTLYVPTFGNHRDADAMAVYESLGFDPIGLDSWTLSNQGHGSLHCITMTYPAIDKKTLLDALRQ